MANKFTAYGIPIISSVNLPAFIAFPDVDHGVKPIDVKIGKVPDMLTNDPAEKKPFSVFNEHEFLYRVPRVARYYIHHGEEIIIEPECDHQEDILLYFYSNCMAAALYQRNLIPFHVSGVFIEDNKVLLFAAPSRTGKSTTSVMLQQKGYAPFTDDTAILNVENGKCYAYASYPMMRLWGNTVAQQTLYHESDKQQLRKDSTINKFGFSFHDRFVADKAEVSGIVHLNTDGDEIKIVKLNVEDALEALSNSMYRKQWINGMKKQLLQFRHLTAIANVLPAWKATRPKNTPTFTSFADAIDSQIIASLKQKANFIN